jgi:hypothetical protein
MSPPTLAPSSLITTSSFLGKISSVFKILNCRLESKYIILTSNFRLGTFYGIYHMSLTDTDSIYAAFEGFVSRVLDEQDLAKRTNTEQFLVDEQGNATIKFKQNRDRNHSMYSAGGGVPAERDRKSKKGGRPIQDENTFSKDLGMAPDEDGTFKLSRAKSASNVKMRKKKCCKS